MLTHPIPQLRTWRLSRGLTLSTLARAAGVSVSCLSRLERGLSTVDAERFSSIVVAISALGPREPSSAVKPGQEGLVGRLTELAGV